eukprot:1958561-Prymnesium_polylepis.2
MLPRRTGESPPRRAGLHAQPDDQDAEHVCRARTNAEALPRGGHVRRRPGDCLTDDCEQA